MITAGAPAEITGDVATGSYDACIVPEGIYTVGTAFIGTRIHCTRIDVPVSGLLPPTMIWPNSVRGAYEVILFAPTRDDIILDGEDLGPRVGLVVNSLVSGPRPWWIALALAFLGIQLLLLRKRIPGQQPD